MVKPTAATPVNADQTVALRLTGWGRTLIQVYKGSAKDNLGLISAGVAYYGFLTLIPALGALVLTYGLITDPGEVATQMRAIVQHVPADAAKLIDAQLTGIVTTATGKKGLGLAIALLLAIYGAMKGAGAVVTALNVAYEVPEERSFVRTTLVNVAVTVGAILVAVVGLASGSVFAALGHSAAGLSPVAVMLIKLVSWAVTAAIAVTAIALLYRFAPARREPRWQWVTPGSLLAMFGFLVVTFGFGLYAKNFGHYGATYGSLSAVVILLLWLYLSAYVLLLGAELNAELERQSAAEQSEISDKVS
ncbi:YihY/virulence factor BrkB family protein [Glacieibacterium megasporae]|uniref:YihY/virulence factor BrkB family protein n=1 Tax=Glacieibacterium megasporae TaxID=2835787 RepID=UPI001C1E0858|nr:YihY/virulence factor BrkB family protein [Polymorphobacter megasporae]UAJ12278.1 YihY/virulence factor BrkB family protein [Polymorphobacter megasporae]